MAINFPNSPSNGDTHTAAGQTFTYDGTVWNPQSGTPVATGTSAPSNPSPGDLWFDTSDGALYFYYADGSSNQWVGVSGPAGADGADGTGYGQLPIVYTEPPTSHSLNSDGSTSTVQMQAVDPEGTAITYSIAYANSTNARPNQLSADTTINQTTGTFTFTPTQTSSNGGTFKARLSASDGITSATRFVNFSLVFNGEFGISPNWSGSSTFELSSSNPLNIGTTGTYTITPSTTFTADIKMWGAGGGAGAQGGSGGGGGFSSGRYTFQSGSTYYILIGQGGRAGAGGTATGGGGSGDTHRGGGGGYTGLFTGSSAAHANALIIAGGGGGAGGGSGSGPGGAGGGTTGQAGNGGSGAQPGGGTQSAGGAASGGSSSAAGSALTGANGLSGGGGGYYGGGSGGDHGQYAPGGGAGSGYIGGTGISNGVTTTGATTTPANSSDSVRSGAGSPQTGSSGAGTDGRFYMSLVS